ncbi:hypothetical protein BCY91_12235 [Pelobium manganitolerans]|uniref:Glycosyl transferase n=1 Tax=Pelobium manganitolerans TaxID=1842495 RepID=A0A419S1P9_9SPHI|nr:glycosyltransferase [Pelobium manganitolerans]RKD12412.1 hypothetical protein BCY91_12235 [Pelobium manganitolerans]
MKQLIISSGNSKNFHQLKNFIHSLRLNGNYEGYIAICDNEITGTWDKPGVLNKQATFTNEHLAFFRKYDVTIYPLHPLIEENEIDEDIIKSILSPTQRYPYKFIYNTLISKKYLGKASEAVYFDSDVFVQKSIIPLFDKIKATGSIVIVKEWFKIKDDYHLNNWMRFSDFSKLSRQENYLEKILNANNYCSGMYGGVLNEFHRFNLLCLLLASNRFINFYSDQPLINVLKSYFHFPVKELDYEYCLHLGELTRDEYQVISGKFQKDGIVPIAVHFNGAKYGELEAVLGGKPLPVLSKRSLVRRIENRLKLIFGK